MMTSRERSITVNRTDLIAKLKANLEIHRKDHKEAIIGYRLKLLQDLKITLGKVESLEAPELETLKPVKFDFPKSYEKDFVDAIEMLEWQVGDTVVLDQGTFKNYVQNEWHWSGGFDVANTMYKNFAAGAIR